MIGESEYELHVRADTENPRYRLWFHFCVRNNKPKQKVVFHVVNFSKSKSLYRDGMSPTVRSQSDPAWKRIHPKHVFYYKSGKKERGGGGAAAARESAAEVRSIHWSPYVRVRVVNAVS
jgi:hypothetical protein